MESLIQELKLLTPRQYFLWRQRMDARISEGVAWTLVAFANFLFAVAIIFTGPEWGVWLVGVTTGILVFRALTRPGYYKYATKLIEELQADESTK